MKSKTKAKKQSPIRRRAKPTHPLVSELSEEGRIAHYSAVLVEDLKSQFKLVIEHVEGVRETLGQKIDTLEHKVGTLEQRFDKLEYKVDKGFAEVAKKFAENEIWQQEAIRVLGRIDLTLDNHEERITHLEGAVAHGG